MSNNPFFRISQGQLQPPSQYSAPPHQYLHQSNIPTSYHAFPANHQQSTEFPPTPSLTRPNVQPSTRPFAPLPPVTPVNNPVFDYNAPSVPLPASPAPSASSSYLPSRSSLDHDLSQQTISIIQNTFKSRGLDGGPTRENWPDWEIEVNAQMRKLDDIVRGIHEKTISKASVDQRVWEAGCDRLRTFFIFTAGTSFNVISQLPGDKIFDALRQRYRTISTVSQRISEVIDFLRIQLQEGAPVMEHYDVMRKLREGVNQRYREQRMDQMARWKAHSVRQHVDPAQAPPAFPPPIGFPALEEDFFSDLFIASLYPSLQKEARRISPQYDRVSDLVAALATYQRIEQDLEFNGRHTALAAPTFGASSSAPSRPVPTPKAPVRTDNIPSPLPFYHSADQVPNYDKWEAGVFAGPSGTWKFRAGRGRCYKCFGEGHRHNACGVKEEAKGLARSKVLEAAGVHILPQNAAVLVALGYEEQEAFRDWNKVGSRWYSGQGQFARFARVGQGIPPAIEGYNGHEEEDVDDDFDPFDSYTSARVARVVHSIRTYKVPAGLVAKASLLLLRRSANCSDQVFRLLEDKTVVFCAPYASNVRVPFVDADFDVGNFARAIFEKGPKTTSQKTFFCASSPAKSIEEIAREYHHLTGETVSVQPLSCQEGGALTAHGIGLDASIGQQLADTYTFSNEVLADLPADYPAARTDQAFEELGVVASTFWQFVERTGWRAT